MDPDDGKTSSASRAPSKPGRPRGFDRTDALVTAMELFWRKGFAATSIADLCDAMGIASPSLYAAFGSKEALYREAISQYERLQVPRIWGGVDEMPTAKQAIERLLLQSAEALSNPCRPRGCMVTLSYAGTAAHADLDSFVSGLRRQALDRVRHRLLRGIDDGDVPQQANIPGLTRFYLALQQAMSIQARDGASQSELEDVADLGMRAWDGLVGSSPGPKGR